MAKPTKKTRDLCVEALENRSLMAVGVSLSSGTLSILGSEAADTITVRQINDRISVTGVAGSYATSSVQRIVVDAGGGNDTVRLDSHNFAGQQPILVPATIYGGAGHDTLFGGAGRDVLNESYDQSGSRNLLCGEGGDDSLYGGTGNDTLFGGSGNDLLNESYGGGSNTLNGEAGDDRLYGGPGYDNMSGGDGAEYLYDGFNYPTTMSGGSGNDQLIDCNASDLLMGGDGDDWLAGYGGDDSLYGGTGSDTMYGGTGHDLLDERADSSVSTNYLYGNEGNDTIYGGIGWDVFYGNEGNDYLEDGNSYPTTMHGGAGNDILNGGHASDHLDGGEGDDQVVGFAGDDTIYGGSGNDGLYGGADNDNLFGGDGHDGLFGGSGTDTLEGDGGADRYLIQSGDTIRDLTGEDARLVFQNGARPWTDTEVVAVDQSLALLVNRTNNTRLLKLSRDIRQGWFGPSWRPELTFVRQGPKAGATAGTVVLGDNDSRGTINIYQGAFDQNAVPHTVIHELGHNWDTEGNGWIPLEAGEDNPFWDEFRALSRWQPNDGRLIVSGPGVRMVKTDNGQWWYDANSGFASNYSRTSPYEDFSESLAAYFVAPGYGLQQPAAKMALMDRFLNWVQS